MRARKACALLVALSLLVGNTPAWAYSQIPDYLCDIGEQLYLGGKPQEALGEFRKALIVEPGFRRAQDYIRCIESELNAAPAAQTQASPEQGTNMIRVIQQPSPSVVERALDALEHKAQTGQSSVAPQPEKAPAPASAVLTRKGSASAPGIILLNESLNNQQTAIEIRKDKQVIVRGQNIQRYLLTEPNILRAEKLNADDLLLTGNDYGYTYLHVWDARGRWTVEFLGAPPAPEGPTVEEEMREQQALQRDFKFRYSLDWSETETGRRFHDLKRQGYNWNHWLMFEGQTPYGYFDTQASVAETTTSRDLTYFTMGLTDGTYGDLKNFDLRAFDFSPYVNNLAFSNNNLRGLYLHSPAFNDHLDYTVFAGREGGGRYGGFSPGLTDLKDSFLGGVEVKYLPGPAEEYTVSTFHGWGADRDPTLNNNGYDIQAHKTIEDWKLNYEAAYDSQNMSHLAWANYSIPRLSTTTELRYTDKEFKTMTGTGWRAGEIGALNTLSFKPVDQLTFTNRLDIYRDRLFPNPANLTEWNEDWNWDAEYALNDQTSFKLDYALQDELGKISPMRSHNGGIGLYQAFEWWTRISTYLTYRHQETEYLTFHNNDFSDEKAIAGTSFRILPDLYYYANYEYNWLTAKNYDTSTNPRAFETGLDLNRRIFTTDYFTDLRLTFRHETDTVSPVSFLSGENFIEYYGELAYRPNPDFEAFCSGRFRWVTSSNPDVKKRLDAFLYAGLRFTWDTGVKWDPTGTISGYVFKDLNGDGLRQDSEPGLEGIKVLLGKNRSDITDKNGQFFFEKVKALKVAVSIDTSTLPKGFVLTTPQISDVTIRHKRDSWVDFGAGSRTEILGIVFNDEDGNGQPGPKERGIKGVTVTLDDGTKSVTDDMGRYFFRKALPGPHTVKLELTTLSADYLPTVPVTKQIELQEGSSYIHNFPLKNVPQEQ